MSTTPVRVVFLDAAILPGGLDFSACASGAIDYQAFGATQPAEVASRIASAAVVITSKVALDAALLGSNPALRLIVVAGAGMDHIDLAAARALGIQAQNVPDYGAMSVAEHVIAALFTLRRQFATYREAALDGRWQSSPRFCWAGPPIRELRGSTLGIVGRGHIGKALAQLARGLGMEVLFACSATRPAQADELPLEDLLPLVDALSLHVPLTAETRGMIGAAQLARMKPAAVLVNTGRGALVDAAALIEALRREALAGAVIDVLDVEPPRDGHVLLTRDIPNLLVTPHVAWASEQAQQRLAEGISQRVVQQVLAAQA